MRKFLLTLAVLCSTVSGWGATPTESFKVSTILPSLGTPEHQYYVRGTINNLYWTSTTDDTSDIANAGKFALYAVPGLQDCYYIYSIDSKKWLTYHNDNRNNQVDFITSADNFDANAYWKISTATRGGNACYQMQPTKLDKDYDGETRIQTDRFANWYTGAGACASIGLWETGAAGDDGSAWSFISVDVTENLDVILSQSLAVANEILATQLSYTKGEGILTPSNVSQIFSSPHSDTDEGVIANLVDNNASTCWHSNWHDGATLGGSHYFEINLAEITPELLSFSYSRRTAAADDHTVRWAVYGVPTSGSIAEDSRDGLTLLALVSTPWVNKNQVFDNLPPFKTQGFKKFRIYSEATEQNRGYFHIGELQLNANTVADSNTDNVKALLAAVAKAEALETVTQADIDELNAVISLFALSKADKARGEELLALTGVGYPAANSEVRIALQNVLDNPASSITDLESAIAVYKTSTDVALPVSGKAYQFAFVANDNDLTNYKVVANGTGLSVSADAEATTFYCVKYTNVDGSERYAFISPEGNFLGYHALTENYRTHEGADKLLQNDFSAAAMVGVSSNVDANTLEKRFGTIYLKVNNRLSGYKGNPGTLILGHSAANLPFDNSDNPYFNGNHTSAIKVTEVTTYEPSDKVLVAASTINPLIQGYIRIGEGVGKYSYTYGENSGNAFVDFETLVNSASTVITNADYSFAINLPTAGFYRIKSMNGNDANKRGKYVQSNGGDLNLTATKDVNSIMYIDGSNLMVSYALGSYLNNYKTPEAKGATGSAWTFLENAQVIGTYTLDNPADVQGGAQYFLSDWTGGVTYGNNDANAAWTFEPVEELPITISAAGYATFYCPVAVTLPEGLTAYYVSNIGNGYATLTEIEGNVVPANTGVILQGAEGQYSLTIGGEASAITNMLEGTVASEYISTTSYVLSAQGEPAVVGFYKATMNFAKNGEEPWAKAEENGTHFLNNGFKAYLPAGENNARALVFDFGTETGIDELKGENENVKTAVYDLAGRRVQNAQKGVFIVNGKVVIK